MIIKNRDKLMNMIIMNTTKLVMNNKKYMTTNFRQTTMKRQNNLMQMIKFRKIQIIMLRKTIQMFNNQNPCPHLVLRFLLNNNKFWIIQTSKYKLQVLQKVKNQKIKGKQFWKNQMVPNRAQISLSKLILSKITKLYFLK